MAVRADHTVAGTNQPLLRQQRVLDTHTTHIEKVDDVVFVGEFARALDLLRRFDVFVGGKVIHHQRDPRVIKHRAGTAALKLVDRDRRGNIVAKAEIQLGFDQLTRLHAIQARVVGQNFLRHCHAHGRKPPYRFISAWMVVSPRSSAVIPVRAISTMPSVSICSTTRSTISD